MLHKLIIRRSEYHLRVPKFSATNNWFSRIPFAWIGRASLPGNPKVVKIIKTQSSGTIRCTICDHQQDHWASTRMGICFRRLDAPPRGTTRERQAKLSVNSNRVRMPQINSCMERPEIYGTSSKVYVESTLPSPFLFTQISDRSPHRQQWRGGSYTLLIYG